MEPVDDDDRESVATCDIWVEVSEEEPDELEDDELEADDILVDISDSDDDQPTAATAEGEVFNMFFSDVDLKIFTTFQRQPRMWENKFQKANLPRPRQLDSLR